MSGILWLENGAPPDAFKIAANGSELLLNVKKLVSQSIADLTEPSLVYKGHNDLCKVIDTPPAIFPVVDRLLKRQKAGHNAGWEVISLGAVTGIHEGVLDNTPVVRVTIGNASRMVLVVSGIHAREWYSQEVILSLTSMLVRAAEMRLSMGSLPPGLEPLDGCRFDIVPITNLFGFLCTLAGDGRAVTFIKAPPPTRFGGLVLEPRLTRKNPRVDINRNFPSNWGLHQNRGCSRDPNREDYCGHEPASEYETRALMELVKRGGYDLVSDWHSYSDEVLRPGGYDPDNGVPRGQPHYEISAELARLAPRILFPHLSEEDLRKQPTFIYPISGGFEDFVLNMTTSGMLTVELGPPETEFSADSAQAWAAKMPTVTRVAKTLLLYFVIRDGPKK